jgi:hypothetical protein
LQVSVIEPSLLCVAQIEGVPRAEEMILPEPVRWPRMASALTRIPPATQDACQPFVCRTFGGTVTDCPSLRTAASGAAIASRSVAVGAGADAVVDE